MHRGLVRRRLRDVESEGRLQDEVVQVAKFVLGGVEPEVEKGEVTIVAFSRQPLKDFLQLQQRDSREVVEGRVEVVPHVRRGQHRHVHGNRRPMRRRKPLTISAAQLHWRV